MKYRKFGNTSQEVSMLGFGCMRMPSEENRPDLIIEDKAFEMLKYAYDNGVNYYDSAYIYHGTGMDSGGQSEPLLGKFIKEYKLEGKIKIATKFPTWLLKNESDFDRYLDEQLKRLQVSSVDFYLLHCLSSTIYPPAKKLNYQKFLDKAIIDGRIKYAGFSFHDSVEVFKQIVDDYNWSFAQIQYNYLDDKFQAGKVGLDYAANKGLAMVVMEPLRGGKLAGKLPSQIEEMFRKTNKSNVELALDWVWTNEKVNVVLSGMSSLEQVKQNIEYIKNFSPLNQDEFDMMKKAKDIFRSKEKIACTACSYCMPCPQGVNIPANFALYNNYFIFEDEASRKSVQFAYDFQISQNQASKCVKCGKCQRHCPQHLPIIDTLRAVAQTFESK